MNTIPAPSPVLTMAQQWPNRPRAALTPCPRCGLRGEHKCLTGDATARDVGAAQWWARKRDSHSHGKYSGEEEG